MTILSTSSVVKDFGHHRALDGITLKVPRQSVYGLLGPNGAGKTTLIRIINRIIGPDSGQVLFEGQPLSDKDIERIGYLPEERGLYRKMKVGAHAVYLARLKGMDKKEAKQAIGTWFERMQITAWWNKRIEELSKGMQQKLQFIVTVVHRPQLLILDEPFSGFDPINSDLIKNEILRLRDEGSTVIFSTHNMNSVEEICDRIALIHQSKLILEGPVEQIREDHKRREFNIRFKGNLIALTNAMGNLCELLSHSVQNETLTAKVRLLGTCGTNDLLRAVLPAVEVLSFNEILPGIHDIFVNEVRGMEANQCSQNQSGNG